MLVNLKEILEPAKNGGYAVGLFNTINLEMARAVIETAEELNAPVICGTAEVLLCYTELENVADYLIPMAKRASVPVAVNFDHGLTFERCMQAVKLGFSSIMYDCSTSDYENNIAGVAEMVKICHASGVGVEGELGHVGDNFGAGRLDDPSAYYTDPDIAAEYVERTGIDALAIAVGNAHGDYKFPPRLDFERISTIADKTGIPLVLHGGSGLSDSDFRTAVEKGICKVNIFTDLDKADKEGLEEGIKNGTNCYTGLMAGQLEAMKKVVRNKIRLFGSDGKA